MSDEIYYADNNGVVCTTANDFGVTMETHKLKCANCAQVFFTQSPVTAIRHGRVPCPICERHKHTILDESKPDFLAKTLNIPATRHTSTGDDITVEEIRRLCNMEDKNMKKTEKNIKKDPNVVITRRCDTSRGIFTVGQLEPTDMFVLIDDEDQTVYMAVYEEDPKYKTKQAVVDMQSGNLLYLDITTKIHVYRAGCELRVGEFIWTSEGYN